MIEREILRREFFAAVLAGVVVACVDVRSRELHLRAPTCADVLEQTHHRRELERERHRPHFLVVRLDDLDFALCPQHHRPLPVQYVEGLKGRVE